MKRNLRTQEQRQPPEDVTQSMELLSARVNERGQPINLPFNEQFRDMPALRWNVKVMGTLLAQSLFHASDTTPAQERSAPFALGWGATKAEDFSKTWFVNACHKLKLAPILHRKVWELAYVLTTLETAGKLTQSKRGVGFGCGNESLPSYFASQGVEVLATDVQPQSQQAQGWIATNQHASGRDTVYKPEFISKSEFNANVSFRYVDMNEIPQDLHESYDFCWSVCALEHLGSIENGLRFVKESAKLLKPGGVAVHTTEFNYSQDDTTIDNWGTVLFRKKDFMALKHSLEQSSCIVPPVSFDVGTSPVDRFIDIPPYPGEQGYFDETMSPLHLKLMVDGFPATCYGLTFQKR
jgi:2-polyprenyl-3-methyl-5-hydroxy-6-metoxy-1,4-benzoquinol methylase